MKDKLVDGLTVYGELSLRGLCKDYIFGKHTAHLYHENTVHPYHKNPAHKIEVLERIHIDIWKPSPTLLARRCIHFMVIMDRYSSYGTVVFLKSKSVDITLNVFKAYQVETKQQTGKKLKLV